MNVEVVVVLFCCVIESQINWSLDDPGTRSRNKPLVPVEEPRICGLDVEGQVK